VSFLNFAVAIGDVIFWLYVIKRSDGMNKAVEKLVEFGIPSSWEELPDGEWGRFDELAYAVLDLDSLTDKEAFYLASHLSDKSDLDGIGNSLCDLIASAPSWPTKDYLYIDNLSDSMMVLKHDAIREADFDYGFTGAGNKDIFISDTNYESEIFKIKDGISRVDLQFLLALFWSTSRDSRSNEMIDHLMPIIQDCITTNKITRRDFEEEFSVALSVIEETYKVVVPPPALGR
jgi:hypothetical protein